MGDNQFGEIQKLASKFEKEKETYDKQNEQTEKCQHGKNKGVSWEKHDEETESEEEKEVSKEESITNQDNQSNRKRKQPSNDHYQTD